ncbi:MAG: alcohol dehydrogenase catalytic domain-containing protein [Clostridia bacterium]|jgi:2-desacetyl-2-hydroxyethyl bacteriochlorophyllide A dehydrogenase|nr:alcohol dehydrogenase catalytic domain-containing protein [Clostridia bacterium]
MKIKAAVLKEFNQPLVTEERELTSLKDGEILVRITASGVCGSDVHMWKGKDPRTPLPLILGHEGVGVVEEVKGEKKDIFADKIKPGDFVIWDRGVTCGNCYFCVVKKEPSLCPKRQVYGIIRDGSYATHLILLEKTRIVKIEEKIDPVVLSPASCSGATTAHTIELCNISEGDTVIIQGPGPMGIFALAFARERGADKIIVIGTEEDKERLELCLEFGATKTLNINETSFEERLSYIEEETKGAGADAVIDCTGSPYAIKEGLKMTAAGCTYTLPGVATPIGSISINFYEDVARKNVRIQGVWVSDTAHLYQAVKLVLSKKYPFEKLITHRFKLEEATEALKIVDVRKAVKAVLIPS